MKKTKSSKPLKREKRDIDRKIQELIDSIERQNQLLAMKIRNFILESQKHKIESQSDANSKTEEND